MVSADALALDSHVDVGCLRDDTHRLDGGSECVVVKLLDHAGKPSDLATKDQMSLA